MRESAATRPAPSFEVIEVLSRAEAAGRLPEDGWRELREDILERPPTPAALNRQLSERYGAPPRPERASEGERLRKLAALAHRLASACAATTPCLQRWRSGRGRWPRTSTSSPGLTRVRSPGPRRWLHRTSTPQVQASPGG